MEIQFQKLPSALDLPTPAYETSGAAGCDLRAAVDDPVALSPGRYAAIPVGFAIALPDGYEAQVRPRSGLAAKFGVTVLNAPGTIDADYRGEVKVILINHGPELFTINRGDRIAQLIIAPITQADFVETDVLQDTQRGSGGFGSTGRS